MADVIDATVQRSAELAAKENQAQWPGNLVRRIVSALIAAPVAIAAVWYGFPWFELLVAAILAAGAFEWTRLCRLGGRDGMVVWLTPLAVMIAAAIAQPATVFPLLLIGTGIGFIPNSGATRSTDGQDSARWRAGGAALLGSAGFAVMYLRIWVPDGAITILWLLAVVWANDIGAYFAGKAIGGPKLIPAVSPGKTWAGFVGGLLLAMVTGGLGAYIRDDTFSNTAIVVALAVAVAAVAGDLLESAVKRRFDAKDSGAIMPGHGGVLDRIDSLLIAAPVLAIIAAFSAGDPITWQ